MPLVPEDQERIDELLLEQLSLYDEYKALQDTLAIFMKKGYLNLSKSRYSLGSTVISPLSFDMKMRASQTWQVNENNEFHKTIPQNKEVTQKETSTLRNRKNTTPESSKEEIIELEQKTEPKQINPIYWFSGLPPITLRNSQASFQEVVKLLPKLATISMQMTRIEQEISNLKKHK